jgi:hypothetical protein
MFDIFNFFCLENGQPSNGIGPKFFLLSLLMPVQFSTLPILSGLIPIDVICLCSLPASNFNLFNWSINQPNVHQFLNEIGDGKTFEL